MLQLYTTAYPRWEGASSHAQVDSARDARAARTLAVTGTHPGRRGREASDRARGRRACTPPEGTGVAGPCELGGQRRTGGRARAPQGGSTARSPPRPAPPLAPARRPSAAPPRFAMVEQGDAAPLLRWAEGPAVSLPQAPELQAGGWARGGGGGARLVAEPPRRREPEESAPSEVLLQPGRLELGDVEEDQVVAVFVVTFDPRSGESRPGTEGRGEGSPRPGALGSRGRTRCARTRVHTPASPSASAAPGIAGAAGPQPPPAEPSRVPH